MLHTGELVIWQQKYCDLARENICNFSAVSIQQDFVRRVFKKRLWHRIYFCKYKIIERLLTCTL